MTTISSTSTTPSTTTSSSNVATSQTATTTGTGSTTTSSVSTTGGVTHLTGTASGLNTQALIDAAVAQRTAPATTLQNKITANQAKIGAYQQLQTLINGLTTSMSKLAAPNFSVLKTGTTDFQNKTVSVSASNGGTASNYITATASGSAVATSYTLSVDQLAEAETVASSAMSQTSALGYTGSFNLQEAGGTAQTINVTSGMSMIDVASAINAVASKSGVSASIVKDTSGNYRLVLSANDTNQAITTSVVSGTDVLNQMGLTDTSGAFTNVLQAAQPAKVTINGSQISNDTNDLTDAVSGLDLQLSNTTPTGVTLHMSVAADPSAVQSDISNFVTAYNSLRSYVATNQKVNPDGTVDSSEPLFADSLLTSASQMLNAIVSTPSPSATGSIKTLADLGITLDNNNNLVVTNQAALSGALQNNLAQVASMFQTSFTPSDPSLKMIRNTSTAAFNFTMDVTANPDGTLASVSVNGDSSLFTVSGASIVGKAGTPYQGLTFALVASSNTSIQVSIQPGLANKIDNFASQYANAGSGLIQQSINQLTQQDDSWNTQITTIQQQAAVYQTQLINKYAKMEQEVNAAQLVQAQIKAILNANTKSG